LPLDSDNELNLSTVFKYMSHLSICNG